MDTDIIFHFIGVHRWALVANCIFPTRALTFISMLEKVEPDRYVAGPVDLFGEKES